LDKRDDIADSQKSSKENFNEQDMIQGGAKKRTMRLRGEIK
jgi:hypothetical protein